ncbi:g2785 [Coccomyxa elongata]
MGRPRIQAARDPNIGTSRIDRLAGLAGEITEAEAQRDNGNERQERNSSGARKRKNLSPMRTQRFIGTASGQAEAGTAAAGGEGGKATQAKPSRRAAPRARKTARKSGSALPAADVPVAEGAQEREGLSLPKPRRGRPPGSGAQALNGGIPKPKKAPKDPNAPKRPRGRPRKYPLPPGFPNIFPAHAAAAARPAAALPPHPREVTRAAQAASAVAVVARIAHPTDLALELAANLALPSTPAVPVQEEQHAAPTRVQPVQASPPQLDRQQGLLGAPPGHVLLPALGDASAPRPPAGALDRPPLPRTRGEMGPPPQPPQPLPALPRRVSQQQSEAPQDDRPEDSANSTVGPVHEAEPALPAGHASPVNSIEEWPAPRTGAGAAARPGSLWGRPGARRIAHTEMLRFGPSLPLAPRVPKSPTERRAAATRARGSTDEEDGAWTGSDAEAGPAATPAVPGRRPDEAAASAAGQNGNNQATEPLEDGAQPNAGALTGQPHPNGSSDTPARLPQDANMAPEGRVLPPVLNYPGSVQRKRKDHMRSLNVMARSLPEVPRLAVKRRRRPRAPHAPSHNQPEGQAGPHMEMQPKTPAGTVPGEHPTRPESNSAAPATEVHEAHEAAADDAVRFTAATDNHEDGIGPSNTPGIGAGSEGRAGGRGVGTEPSPKKRLSGQGTYDMPSPQKRLQIQNRRAMAQAPAHKEGGMPLDAPMTEQQLEYAGTAPQTTDVEDEGLPGHVNAIEDQAGEGDAGQENADIDEQPQQQISDMEEQPEQQVTQEHPEEEMLARDVEQAGGETDQEELNRNLLQRLAEEATLVIEAQEAADTAIMAEEGLEHLKMQHRRQEKIFNEHESAVEEVSRALQASAESTKRVQETQEKIAELQEELKRNIAASEAARLHAVATLRKQTTLKEDLETARAEVAQLLQAQPADLAHLSASVAAQTGHVQLLRSASQEAARRLQVVRTNKDRLLRALGRRGAAIAAAGNA